MAVVVRPASTSQRVRRTNVGRGARLGAALTRMRQPTGPVTVRSVVEEAPPVVEEEVKGEERIVFSTDTGGMDVQGINDLLLLSSGIPPRDSELMTRALNHSSAAIVALAGEEGEQQVVGFARAYSDGAFSAMVTDVALHPLYVSRVGTSLVKEFVRELRQVGIGSYAVIAPKSEHAFLMASGFRETHLIALQFTGKKEDIGATNDSRYRGGGEKTKKAGLTSKIRDMMRFQRGGRVPGVP